MPVRHCQLTFSMGHSLAGKGSGPAGQAGGREKQGGGEGSKSFSPRGPGSSS